MHPESDNAAMVSAIDLGMTFSFRLRVAGHARTAALSMP
jgi:hypothetical protein